MRMTKDWQTRRVYTYVLNAMQREAVGGCRKQCKWVYLQHTYLCERNRSNNNCDYGYAKTYKPSFIDSTIAANLSCYNRRQPTS